MRFLVLLYQPTCSITDKASTTNSPPIITSTNSCRTITATVPSAAPSANAPTSPINTCAGAALNHKKPKHAPHMAAQNTITSFAPGTKGSCR